MSSKESVENAIVKQCLDLNGLPSILRENGFDEHKYTQLRDLIDEYSHLIENSAVVNRKVAGCLRLLEQALESAVAFHDRQATLSEVGRKVKKAHSEIWELQNAILDVNL